MPSPPDARRTRTLWIVAALAVLLAGGRAALPALIGYVACEQATAALGVPVAIDDVDLWLVSGGIALEGVRVDSAHGGEAPPLLAADRLYARFAWLSPLSGEIRLREIASDGLRLEAERNAEGAPVLPPGLVASGAEESPEPDAEPGTAWPLAIDRVTLSRTGLVWSASDAEGRPPLVDLQIGELRLGDVGFRDGQLTLGQFGLAEPRLRVHPELMRDAPEDEAAQSTSEPEASEADDDVFPLRLAQLSIDGASFTVLTPAREITIALRVDAHNISTAEGERFPSTFELTSDAGGRLALEGELGLHPVHWKGRLQWQNLSLPNLAGLALVPDPGPLDWIRAGQTSGDLALALSLEPGAAELARISGQLELRDFELRDTDETFALAFARLALDLEQLALPSDLEREAPEIALASVELLAPHVRYTLSPAEAQPPSEATEATEAESPAPHVALNSLRVSQGRVELEDRSLSPPVRTELRGLEVSADGVRWPEGDAKRVRVRAASSTQGAFELTGSLAGGSGELRAVLDDLGLTPFTPYAAHYVGYGIDAGSATLESDLVLSKGALSSTNQLMLHELRMSAEGEGVIPDPLGVPIDVALALLRNARDEIHLDVPVTVSEGSTRSGTTTAIRSALQQAIIGALSAPLQLAGALPLPIQVPGLGSRDGPTRGFTFAPGSSQPDADAASVAEGLTKLLAERPALGLTLQGSTDEDDLAMLTRRLLLDRIEAGDAPKLPDSGFLQRRRLRQALARQLAGEPDELERDERHALERWLGLIELPPERLAALAHERAVAVRKLLDGHAELPADRLSLGPVGRGRREVRVSISAYPPPGAS